MLVENHQFKPIEPTPPLFGVPVIRWNFAEIFGTEDYNS